MVVAAETAQMDSKGLSHVEELFNQQIATGVHPGFHDRRQDIDATDVQPLLNLPIVQIVAYYSSREFACVGPPEMLLRRWWQ